MILQSIDQINGTWFATVIQRRRFRGDKRVAYFSNEGVFWRRVVDHELAAGKVAALLEAEALRLGKVGKL